MSAKPRVRQVIDKIKQKSVAEIIDDCQIFGTTSSFVRQRDWLYKGLDYIQ